MKKKILLFVIAALAVGGAFAQNHHYGIDISNGVGIGSLKYTMKDGNIDFSSLAVIPDIKVHSWNGIWADHKFGFYASINAGFGFQLKQKANGTIIPDDDGENLVSIGPCAGFAAGPMFGIDLGSTRFNVGAGLHFNVSTIYDKETVGTIETKYTSAIIWLGFEVSPQFRFTVNRRCSFVVGCDFDFDFAFERWDNERVENNGYETSNDTTRYKIKDTFRFVASPYIGVGINFGA